MSDALAEEAPRRRMPARRRMSELGIVAMVDALANGVAAVLVLLVASLATDLDKLKKPAVTNDDPGLMLSRRLSTLLEGGHLPVTESYTLHDYKACDRKRAEDPFRMPTLELYNDSVLITNEERVISAHELMDDTSFLDRYVKSLDRWERDWLRIDVHDVSLYYIVLSILFERGYGMPKHFHFTGEDEEDREKLRLIRRMQKSKEEAEMAEAVDLASPEPPRPSLRPPNGSDLAPESLQNPWSSVMSSNVSDAIMLSVDGPKVHKMVIDGDEEPVERSYRWGIVLSIDSEHSLLLDLMSDEERQATFKHGMRSFRDLERFYGVLQKRLQEVVETRDVDLFSKSVPNRRGRRLESDEEDPYWRSPTNKDLRQIRQVRDRIERLQILLAKAAEQEEGWQIVLEPRPSVTGDVAVKVGQEALRIAIPGHLDKDALEPTLTFLLRPGPFVLKGRRVALLRGANLRVIDSLGNGRTWHFVELFQKATGIRVGGWVHGQLTEDELLLSGEINNLLIGETPVFPLREQAEMARERTFSLAHALTGGLLVLLLTFLSAVRFRRSLVA